MLYELGKSRRCLCEGCFRFLFSLNWFVCADTRQLQVVIHLSVLEKEAIAIM